MRKGPFANFRFKVQLSKGLLQKKASQGCLTSRCYPLHQGSTPVSWRSCLACSAHRRMERAVSSGSFSLRGSEGMDSHAWCRAVPMAAGCPSFLSCHWGGTDPFRVGSLCRMNVDTLGARAVLEAPVSLCDFWCPCVAIPSCSPARSGRRIVAGR